MYSAVLFASLVFGASDAACVRAADSQPHLEPGVATSLPRRQPRRSQRKRPGWPLEQEDDDNGGFHPVKGVGAAGTQPAPVAAPSPAAVHARLPHFDHLAGLYLIHCVLLI